MIPPSCSRWHTVPVCPCVHLPPAAAAGLHVWHAAGMAPVGPRMSWALTADLSVNYIVTLRPAAEVEAGAVGRAGDAGEGVAAEGGGGVGTSTVEGQQP